jgi:hypothetical protein
MLMGNKKLDAEILKSSPKNLGRRIGLESTHSRPEVLNAVHCESQISLLDLCFIFNVAVSTSSTRIRWR